MWTDGQGTHLYWNASILGTQILGAGQSGKIEFTVSLPAIPAHPTFDWVYNNYKIDSDQSHGEFQILETAVVHSLFVRKKADKAFYMRGDTVNYTITYGNELDQDANNTIITDLLPDVEFLEAKPEPNSINGKVLKWNIGLLRKNSGGTILLYTRINKSLTDIKFHSSQSVSGQGYMQMRQMLSTARDPKRLTNYVNITALYPFGRENNSSSASIGLLDALGTEVSIQGHGSGSYSREEETSLLTNNSSIKVETSLHESYQPSSFTLPRGREMGYNSKWSEAVVSKNRITDATTEERYMYARSIDRNSSLHLDKNGSTLISETAFEGSGHIGQLKGSNVSNAANNAAFSRRAPAYDSDENYLGSFKVLTKFDEYGKSVISSRSVNGTGYVSSDKRIAKSQRSYESGTGSYQAEDEIRTQSSYMAKDLIVSYAPMSYSYTPDFKVDLSQKWKEGMWSRSGKHPAKGTKSSAPASFIGEEYSMADYLNMSTVASGLNQMTNDADFTGRARLRIAYDNVFNVSGHNRMELDEEYLGQYEVARHVQISGVARFNEPHLSIIKTGRREASQGTNIDYLITVTNDGNRDLGPVYVQDLLPPGTEYAYSSARPTQTTQNSVQWTLLNLGIGTSNQIELKLNIKEDQDSLVNRVQARGVYGDQWVSAENYSSLQLGWLSCCPPQLLAAKEGFIDSKDNRTVHYRILIKNREKEIMVATVTDQLPDGMVFINSTTTPSDYRSDRVSWNIVDLRPGEMRTIDYLARANHGGEFINQAHINARYQNGTDSAFADVSSSVYVAGDAYYSSSDWQPPACFGLNCTQQGTAEEWIPCVSCGIVEPQPINVPCAVCAGTEQEYGDDIP
jgi:large repetitive protein